MILIIVLSFLQSQLMVYMIIDDGYLEGAYIDFFEINLKKNKDDEAKLDRFTFLKIKSLSPRTMFLSHYLGG